MSKVQVIGEMLKILGDELMDAQKSSDEVTIGTFLSKKMPAEVESEYYGTPPRKRFVFQAQGTPLLDLVELEKIEIIADLKTFRNNTESRFDRMQKRTEKKYFETDDEIEKQIIKAHSISASILDRFPVKSTNFNTKGAAERIIKSIKHPAKKASKNEEQCLEILNKKCKHGFMLNNTTFLKGKLSGTPDAISMKGDKIVDVAEFKQVDKNSKNTTTVKNLTNQGKQQVQAYISILGLESGQLLVADGDGHEHYEVSKDTDFDSKLNSRLIHYKETSDFINN